MKIVKSFHKPKVDILEIETSEELKDFYMSLRVGDIFYSKTYTCLHTPYEKKIMINNLSLDNMWITLLVEKTDPYPIVFSDGQQQLRVNMKSLIINDPYKSRQNDKSNDKNLKTLNETISLTRTIEDYAILLRGKLNKYSLIHEINS